VPDHATPCPCSAVPAAAPASRRVGLGVLAEYVPAVLIDEVLADTGRIERRVRRLPARVTVLFILALTLFSGQGYRAVWRELAHTGGVGPGVTPSSSGLAQARRRVGLAPLAALFARLRGVQAAPGMAEAFMAGLRLVSWDATMLDVADSAANTAAFITSSNRRGVGAFAQVRLMALIEVGTHAVIDAVFGAESEQVLAGRLLTALTPGMLRLGDRNFPSRKLWGQTAATEAHLLWRAKAGLPLPRVGGFADGSRLAVLPKPGTGRRAGHWVRVIEYTVTVTATHPVTGTVTTRTELFRLLTTITDPTTASAADLAGGYRQRWESETGYPSDQDLPTRSPHGPAIHRPRRRASRVLRVSDHLPGDPGPDAPRRPHRRHRPRPAVVHHRAARGAALDQHRHHPGLAGPSPTPPSSPRSAGTTTTAANAATPAWSTAPRPTTQPNATLNQQPPTSSTPSRSSRNPQHDKRDQRRCLSSWHWA
jgi:hypothetical protein